MKSAFFVNNQWQSVYDIKLNFILRISYLQSYWFKMSKCYMWRVPYVWGKKDEKLAANRLMFYICVLEMSPVWCKKHITQFGNHPMLW